MRPLIEGQDVFTFEVRREGEGGVSYLCPFCAKRHVHGWPFPQEREGYRLSHCDWDDSPYQGKQVRLLLSEDAEQRQGGYALILRDEG